jgi:hypothetical protein
MAHHGLGGGLRPRGRAGRLSGDDRPLADHHHRHHTAYATYYPRHLILGHILGRLDEGAAAQFAALRGPVTVKVEAGRP